MHLYDFLTDQVQSRLKHEANLPEQDRFENILRYYKDRFMQSFEDKPANKITLNLKDDSEFLPVELKGDQDISRWFEVLFGIVQDEADHLTRIFEEVIDCYLLVIRGRHHTAVLKMYDILEKYKLLDDVWIGKVGLYFRCANLWPGAKPEELETYCHIPFNKRNLIKNQRFSISGMPVWYGGASLLTSYYEMRRDTLESNKDLAISAWGFNLFFDRQRPVNGQPIEDRSKIWDITNQIYDVINYSFMKFKDIKDVDQRRNFFGNHPFLFEHSLRVGLRKFVISNLCTFKTRADGHVFVEEYIIPQILTEAVRLHKYNGILFPSTQYSARNVSFNGTVHTNFYKSNLAMFTEYDMNENHDQHLIKNFGIEIIIEDNVSKFDISEAMTRFNQIKIELLDFFNENPAIKYEKVRMKYLQIFDHLDNQIEIYQNITIDGTPYLDTYAGRAELFATDVYVINLHRQVRHFYGEEFEEYLERKSVAGQ